MALLKDSVSAVIRSAALPSVGAGGGGVTVAPLPGEGTEARLDSA